MTSLTPGVQKAQIYDFHKAIGFLVLLLIIFRWYWMLTNVRPRPLSSWSLGELGMVQASKWLLMLLMLLMPVSGMMYSLASGYNINVFGVISIDGFEYPNFAIKDFAHGVHTIGAYVIATLVILHIIAALKHHLVRRDGTLKRMLGH